MSNSKNIGIYKDRSFESNVHEENLQSFNGKRARSGCLVRVTASFLCKIKNTKISVALLTA